MKNKKSYLKFVLIKEGKKTDQWRVCAEDCDEILGEIRWYSPWRKYAFYPGFDTLFEPTCLYDLANFIIRQMEMRKRK